MNIDECYACVQKFMMGWHLLRPWQKKKILQKDYFFLTHPRMLYHHENLYAGIKLSNVCFHTNPDFYYYYYFYCSQQVHMSLSSRLEWHFLLNPWKFERRYVISRRTSGHVWLLAKQPCGLWGVKSKLFGCLGRKEKQVRTKLKAALSLAQEECSNRQFTHMCARASAIYTAGGRCRLGFLGKQTCCRTWPRARIPSRRLYRTKFPRNAKSGTGTKHTHDLPPTYLYLAADLSSKPNSSSPTPDVIFLFRQPEPKHHDKPKVQLHMGQGSPGILSITRTETCHTILGYHPSDSRIKVMLI